MSVHRVRICPVCGTENPVTVSDCHKCGTDILAEPVETRSGLAPQVEVLQAASPVEPAEPVLVLEVLQTPGLSFKVRAGQTVGRTDASEVVLSGVPNADYISRRMATFSLRGDQWFVQHVANTNYITVDGDKYTGDEEVALHDGSILGLALCQFTVRLPPDQNAENRSAVN